MFLHGDYRGYLPLFFIAVLLGYAHLASFTCLIYLAHIITTIRLVSQTQSSVFLAIFASSLSTSPGTLSSFTISCSLPSGLAFVWREGLLGFTTPGRYGTPSRLTWRTVVSDDPVFNDSYFFPDEPVQTVKPP
ncbi:hypothetical protein QR685DRAFT_527814 [Neurospora intermedia]|uniref:Secreted protein n=1 Tax=Neurospora intermedia TaxID=5142 RepID=A0ABR3DDN4_NEUIN